MSFIELVALLESRGRQGEQRTGATSRRCNLNAGRDRGAINKRQRGTMERGLLRVVNEPCKQVRSGVKKCAVRQQGRRILDH